MVNLPWECTSPKRVIKKKSNNNYSSNAPRNTHEEFAKKAKQLKATHNHAYPQYPNSEPIGISNININADEEVETGSQIEQVPLSSRPDESVEMELPDEDIKSKKKVWKGLGFK